MGGLVVVGGRSSVVRALVAQVSDLGLIPCDFHIPSLAYVVKCLTSYSPGYIEPSKAAV